LDTPLEIDVIVVGGCANGILLRNVQSTAEWFELSRPDHIKPLASSWQDHPDIVRESDTYELHPISMENSDGSHNVLGIAVVKGKSLTWAVSQLIISHVKRSTDELIEQGLMKPSRLDS
jgi:hypothetical protein